MLCCSSCMVLSYKYLVPPPFISCPYNQTTIVIMSLLLHVNSQNLIKFGTNLMYFKIFIVSNQVSKWIIWIILAETCINVTT